MDKTALTTGDDLVAEVKDRLVIVSAAESDNRRDALDDLEFLVGNQWPEQMRTLRAQEGRPALTINKLPTFLHQVTNQLRMNKPSIKVHPVEDADEDTAEVLQGVIRHIEYASSADVAYDTAASAAAAHGKGYFRLITDYVAEDSFDQEIRFKRIFNPFTVYWDIASTEPDGSDAMWCIITEEIPKSEFMRLYPRREVPSDDFRRGAGDGAVQWGTETKVRIAEYYRVEMKEATLVQFVDGSTAWKDDLIKHPEIAKVIKRERVSERRTVRWYKLDGNGVIEDADIPCKWIPVFPIVGDEVNVNGRVVRSGVVRWAKDPARMYNFFMTSATEEISLRPKVPYIGAEGQFEGHEAEWRQANNRSFPYLEYSPITIDGTLAPPPQRQGMADIPSGALALAMHASDNIKATTGLFDSSLGARGTATSGIQEQSQQRQGDIANFHYSDNTARTIKHAGRCIVDMVPKVYDAPRIVRIMGEDESIETAQINQPVMVDGVETVINDLTVGTYDVTISVGPSYSTAMQEAAASMSEVGQSWPKIWDIAGDKMVKGMGWPGSEEIAERIKRTIPPAILGDEGEQQPLPPEVQQQLQEAEQIAAQAGQFIQQLQAELQAAQKELADKSADLALRKYENDTGNLTKIAIEEMKQVGQQAPPGAPTYDDSGPSGPSSFGAQ